MIQQKGSEYVESQGPTGRFHKDFRVCGSSIQCNAPKEGSARESGGHRDFGGFGVLDGQRAVAAVAGEMWEPAFGAGFQAPRANQESQVSYSARPPSARHFHRKAANSAHFLRNRIFGLPDRLKSSFSRKPPKMHPSSDSCAVPKILCEVVYDQLSVGVDISPLAGYLNA